jgi:asparagine synthase (glutamine-hydrolysing)
MMLLIALYKKASSANHRVVLDGVEGDLVISLGRNYPAGLVREGRWGSAFLELRGMIANDMTDLSLSRLISGTLRSALPPDWLRRLRFRSRATQLVKDELTNSLLSKNMIANTEISNRYRQYLETRVAPYRTLGEQHRWWVQQPFIAVALERYDRAAGVCGIEPRHPLLDKRIIEFCLSLPWQLKVNLGWSKWILRQVMQSQLPQSILWRRDKPHLGPGFSAQWMVNNWPDVQATISATESIWSAYADRKQVLPYFDTPTYNPLETLGNNQFIVYFLATWLKKFN